MRLVDAVESGVRTENTEDDDLVFLLVVFEQGGDHTRESERASVRGVAKLHPAFRVTVTQVQTVRTIGLEVGD